MLSRTGEPGEVKFASVFFLCKVRHADSHPLSALPISLDFSFFFLSCPRLSSVNTHARLLPITAPVHIVCNVCRQLFFFCLFLFFFFFCCFCFCFFFSSLQFVCAVPPPLFFFKLLLPIPTPFLFLFFFFLLLFFFFFLLFFFSFVVVVVVSITARYKSSARSSLPYFFLNFSESKCVDTYR